MFGTFSDYSGKPPIPFSGLSVAGLPRWCQSGHRPEPFRSSRRSRKPVGISTQILTGQGVPPLECLLTRNSFLYCTRFQSSPGTAPISRCPRETIFYSDNTACFLAAGELLILFSSPLFSPKESHEFRTPASCRGSPPEARVSLERKSRPDGCAKVPQF